MPICSKNLSYSLSLQLNAVAYLMYAMGNTAYVESQRQASIALAVSYHTSPTNLISDSQFLEIYHRSL